MNWTKARSALGAFAGVLGIAGCASDKTVTFSYALGFPSNDAAIATENVKVFVFAADSHCLELVQNTLAGGALPATLAETPSQNLCAYFDGKGDSVGIELGVGEYNVLALGTRAGSNYLIGCSRQIIDEDTAPVPINMSLVDATQSIPQSSCRQVSEKCTAGKEC